MTTEPKTEPHRDESLSSGESTPEHEVDALSQEQVTVQKRKGGRKPIYATSEERKQRNRQAQAAFRERRTEYIKQLETTIKHHEDALQNLQQSHRSAADECLMLRYKNSLLERILLEKGIDVQAELSAKTGSPHGGPRHPATSGPQPSPIHRAIMNRHHQTRRSMSGVPPVDTSIASMPPNARPVYPGKTSPMQLTPPSQAISPTSTSSSSRAQGVMTPPVLDVLAQQRPQQRTPQQQPGPPNQPHSLPPPPHAMTSAGVPPNMTASSGQAPVAGHAPTSYYPSSFQKQEYDAQSDMVDESDPTEHAGGPGPYPHPFPSQAAQHPPPRLHPDMPSPAPPEGTAGPNYGQMAQMYGPMDVTTNDDQFGLWQSMTFPTQYSFPPSSMR
ncbi:MAG: hypothetical protein M1817_004876 [Caeruleum heppii]|nr:MAG: hypothetical protein M1817_004876 [Caeruleum heppii]